MHAIARAAFRVGIRPSVTLLAAAFCLRAAAHNVEARYIQELPWALPHIERVVALGYSELGLNLDVSRGKLQTIAGRPCFVGNLAGLVIDRSFAFDIDEPVELTITYAPALTTTPIRVVWNSNGGIGQGAVEIRPEPGRTFRRASVTLERARFARFGTQGVDLAIGSAETEPESGLPQGKVALCGVELARSGKTPRPAAFGRIHLEVVDAASGRPSPVRVGLYDSTGRAPLPSDQALLVERFADKVRLLPVAPRAFWPSKNRVAFYVNGSYEAVVPSASYELVVARGPEYRVHQSRVDVLDGHTTEIQVRLERYADLPSEGWFSGDDHIHLARDRVADPAVWTQIAAEDVHVGNLLQMGNITGTYFEQPAWGKAGRFEQQGYLVASGQEDPRTGQLGHTIHHDLQSPIHLSEDSYFLYQRAFEEVHRQGGISGYAHLNGGWFNVRRGVALEVPFGHVDFLEVFQAGKLSTEIWYDFLNLGYRLVPSAGSDFPYTDLPGVVRGYVRVDHYDADAWYGAFRSGHTYVTNGPFLDLDVNGRGMGDELRVTRGTALKVTARARMNPDVDALERLEVVVLGDVVAVQPAHGGDQARVETTITADRSMWIAVRAYGDRHEEWNSTAAHSAPVYVVVDGQPTWRREKVAGLVERERSVLKEILAAPLVPTEDLEAFETGKLLLRQWPKQLPALKRRVAEADAKYRELLKHARSRSQP